MHYDLIMRSLLEVRREKALSSSLNPRLRLSWSRRMYKYMAPSGNPAVHHGRHQADLSARWGSTSRTITALIGIRRKISVF